MISLKKNPNGGRFLNLEIPDLRHPWVRGFRADRQPNGVAVKRTGRGLDGRGFNSSYDHIKDPSRKNKTRDNAYQIYRLFLRAIL